MVDTYRPSGSRMERLFVYCLSARCGFFWHLAGLRSLLGRDRPGRGRNSQAHGREARRDLASSAMILAILQARMSSTRLPGKVLMPILRERLAGHSAAELGRMFEAQGLPYAPIRRPDELFDDEHLVATGGLAEITRLGMTADHMPELADLIAAAAEVGDAGADEFGGGCREIHAAAGGDAPFEDGDGGVGVAGDLLAEIVGVLVATAEEGAEAVVVDDDEFGAVAGWRSFGGGERDAEQGGQQAEGHARGRHASNQPKGRRLSTPIRGHFAGTKPAGRRSLPGEPVSLSPRAARIGVARVERRATTSG